MKIQQVYNEVAALCTEGKIDSRRAFYASLNRALSEINRLDPLEKVCELRHYPPPLLFGFDTPRMVTPGEPLTFTFSRTAAFAFAVAGTGRVRAAVDDSLAETVSFPGEAAEGTGTLFCPKPAGGLERPVLYRRRTVSLSGKASARITLTFDTDGLLVLESGAFYGAAREEDGDDVPLYARETCYDLAKIDGCFLSFTGKVLRNGKKWEVPPEKLSSSGRVTLPNDSPGLYTVCYYRSPGEASADRAQEELELRYELQHLAPILTAYYYCLEDDNPKAEAFLARYRSLSEGLERRSRSSEGEGVRDCRGW